MVNFNKVAADQVVVSKAALDASQKELVRLRKLVDAQGEAPQPSDTNAATIQALQDELIALKAAKAITRMGSGSLKVTEKGGISLYIGGKYPVTLYLEQWLALFDGIADLQTFIGEHRSELKTKAA